MNATESVPTLERFFELLASDNPFEINRVVNASFEPADAEAVHAPAFDELVARAADVTRRPSAGVVLWGEAGIGKTHVLSRLERWAKGRAHFVYITNLQASPEHLPRSLLRSIVSILTGGKANIWGSDLFMMVNAAMRLGLPASATPPYPWSTLKAAHRRVLAAETTRHPGLAAVQDRAIHEVFYRLFRSTYRMQRQKEDDGAAAAALRWLHGDAIGAEEAARLGLRAAQGAESVAALTDDEEIKKTLAALALLASCGDKPLLICLDQVDNLEAEQMAALGRFLHALIDVSTNVLVVTSGVRESLKRWQEDRVIQQSTWDRLGQHVLELQRVSPDEARGIVQARLASHLLPYREIPDVARLVDVDPLFPLGERWEARFLAGKIEVRPRDVINWAREGWREQRRALLEAGGPAWLESWADLAPSAADVMEAAPAVEQLIADKARLKFEELKAQRMQHRHMLPPDSHNLAGLIQSLLKQWIAAESNARLTIDRARPARHGVKETYDFIVRRAGDPAGTPDGETRTAVLCLTEENKNSLTASLRRMAEDPSPPDRVILVTDERRRFDLAARGEEHLQTIRGRHGDDFQHLRMTFDEYAELDALQGVIGLARSGDLEIDLPGGNSRRVSEEQAAAWAVDSEAFREHRLLRILLEEAAVDEVV